MRVAFVVHGAIDQPTGGYVYDRSMVDGLRGRGHSVSVVSILPSVPRGAEGALVAGGRLAFRLLRSGFDVVVADELCHGEVGPAFALLALVPRSRSPRRVLLVHHLTEWEDGRARSSERRCLRGADAIVTTSETSRARLHSLGFRSEQCPPGSDRLPHATRSERRTDRVELLFVGTWTPRKQLVLLIEALSRLDANYGLTVVGDPERDRGYAARVHATLARFPEVSRRTTLLGTVDDARLAALYADSDVLVSPSDFEGYGMAIAEAVHAGLPVVAASGGAVPEVVRDGQEALLVTPLDTTALATALAQVTSDPARLARMRGFAEARSLPRWTESVERFERLLVSN